MSMFALNRVLVTIVAAFLSASCAPKDKCEEARGWAEHPESVEALKKWVDTSLTNGTLNRRRKDGGNVRIPGEYRVRFDPIAYGLEGDIEARVIIGRESLPTAVFFGTENMSGIIIETEGRRNEIIPQRYLLPTGSPRVFLLCRAR